MRPGEAEGGVPPRGEPGFKVGFYGFGLENHLREFWVALRQNNFIY